MTETALHDLATPPGLKGSGRLRYAAAMALHRAGLISDAMLEVYRVASANDARNPADLLADRGLVPPAALGPTPEILIRGLLDQIDRYLTTLPGPGVAEVRAGIAAFRAGMVCARPRPHPTIECHLAAALQDLHASHPALAHAIAAAAPHLHWTPFEGYPPEDIGEIFACNHAFASILGTDAPIPAQDFDLGLFLIAPHILYRDHHHAASELYAPLTGPHGWRFGPGRPLLIKPAHHPVWNSPHRPHLTKVGPTPFLAVFGWTSDVSSPAEVIPARDWPTLESLRLDT